MVIAESVSPAPLVLVADDDQDILDAVGMLLEDEGFRVITIDQCQEVFEQVKENHPDVVMLDIWMSGCSGKEMCARIKQDVTIRDTPVILFSANRDIVSMAEEAGADDYLEKPFEMDDLLAKLAKFVSRNN